MNYVFANKPEFVEPIRVLFLCGSSFKDIKEDKRIILKEYLEQDSANKVILLEKYFEFGSRKRQDGFLSYYDAKLFNLYNIENLAALSATNVIVLHESISTAGEIGVFASNPFLREKLITMIPERYSIEEEKLSNFLHLAFWNKKEAIIPHRVIRYYPIIKEVYISENRSTYYTYFFDNKIPKFAGQLLTKMIGNKCISNVCLSYAKKDKYKKYPSYIKHDPKCTYVNLEYSVFKNYIISLLTISEFRRSLLDCKMVYEVRDLFIKTFLNILKNTVVENTKQCSDKLIVLLNKQPNFKIEDAISFMIYMLHSCGFINIKNKDNGMISVHHKKSTANLLEKYTYLVRKIKPMEWGD